MARIAGIQIIRANNGTIKKVIFDYEKHEAVLKPILKNMGAIDDDFEKKWHTGITGDVLKSSVAKHMAKFPWKK